MYVLVGNLDIISRYILLRISNFQIPYRPFKRNIPILGCIQHNYKIHYTLIIYWFDTFNSTLRLLWEYSFNARALFLSPTTHTFAKFNFSYMLSLHHSNRSKCEKRLVSTLLSLVVVATE